MSTFFYSARHRVLAAMSLLLGLQAYHAFANPTGGTVVQGSASITSQGSQLTIQQSSVNAQINWSTFNIGVGETTTFVQPSSSSITWNQINDSNPSQILGNLNANGYILLQNQSGFYIGGQAAITAHGILMTTSPTPAPDLTSGGVWQFNAPPPTASIINYGQIKSPDGDKGGSAFLIAANIQNNGSITTPQGNIGLFAGKNVLVSMRPDGRGLSAKVTLPQGSVDNEGQLVADAGTIQMHAQVVNQGGLVQANSIQNVNGVIELVASDSLNLGASSVISAQGDSSAQSSSQGGFVIAKSDNTFSDSSTSTINVSGQSGGHDGVVEIFGNGTSVGSVQSQVDGTSAAAFQSGGGLLMVNPYDLTLSSSVSTPSAGNPNLQLSVLSSFSKIDLFAEDNIKLSSAWTLAPNLDPNAIVSLFAGNIISLNSSLTAASGTLPNNWAVSMVAGSMDLSAKPDSGDGIYLNGNSAIQTQNGFIDLWAANEVIVNPALSTSTGIRTLAGGSITVTAEYGDVNTGENYNGFNFGRTTPLYTVSTSLGGISTRAGGDVTITAGGNVTSYLPVQSDYSHAIHDAGTGAFGSAPGNVTITAGGNVFGHYVVADGVGTVSAGGDIGAPTSVGGFALSLIKGNWNVSAPNGTIYLQDVRNPNGVLNDSQTYPAYHVFDYDPAASVSLSAGNSVEITGAGAPHIAPSEPNNTIPLIFPPSLQVNAGKGGFVLDSDVILFPSALGELGITTTGGGDFRSFVDPNDPSIVNVYTLSMSDSAAHQWSPGAFGLADDGPVPPELNNPNPVELSISGSIKNVNLRTTKATEITVAGDTYNFGFEGENLHVGDVTFINVAGKISYPPVYTFINVSENITSPDSIVSSSWDAIFSLLVDPNAALALTSAELTETPQQQTASAYQRIRLNLSGGSLQPGYNLNANPGFIYNAATGKLGFQYQMSPAIFTALDSTSIRILKLDQSGNVIIEKHADGKYYYATTTVSFIAPSELQQLYAQSQSSSPPASSGQANSPGFQIGGPGQFNISASSIDLGSSGGIMSWGIANGQSPINYANLAPFTPQGAAINLNIGGDLTLLTSTIASIYGGGINVHAGGSVSLSVGDFNLIPPGSSLAYGIYTTDNSDVTVDAQGDINVGGSRIGTFNGGDVAVRSENGSVNAGNGANSALIVYITRVDPITGQVVTEQISNPRPFGSGILALAPEPALGYPGSGGIPGNITVETPHGDIVSTLGGIAQFVLGGKTAPGPTVTLTAGTAPSNGDPGYAGNVDLGQAGVIGGTINITAQGDIKGLIVSSQNANINAAQSFSGTLLSGGTANVNATAGSISGTIIGVGGVNASGGSGVTASVLGQNVSIGGGAAQSTLGTSAAATSTSQAAAQQSNTEAEQQLAKDSTQDDQDKKKGKQPVLTRRVGRVTVILPNS